MEQLQVHQPFDKVILRYANTTKRERAQLRELREDAHLNTSAVDGQTKVSRTRIENGRNDGV